MIPIRHATLHQFNIFNTLAPAHELRPRRQGDAPDAAGPVHPGQAARRGSGPAVL